MLSRMMGKVQKTVGSKQCYMFRTLSQLIFRDFSVLNYTDFLHQLYSYTL
jgi:hypothetical protein